MTKTMLEQSKEIRSAGARLAGGKSFEEMFTDMIRSASKPQQEKEKALEVLDAAKRKFASISDQAQRDIEISNYCNREVNGAPQWARQKAIDAYRQASYNQRTSTVKASAGSRLAGEPDDSLQLQPLPNEMPGGLGDKLTPADVDPVEFDMGMEMEKEHTPDEATRQEIVLDHLAEDPAYYSKLKQMEGQGVDVQMFGQMRATKL